MNSIGAHVKATSWWRTPAGLLLVAALLSSVVAWWLIALPVLSFANVPRHADHFGLLYFHAIGGSIMLFLGALNLYIGSTRAHFAYHRLVGRLYVFGGVPGVIAADLIMLWSRAHKPEGVVFSNVTVSLLTLSFAWFAAVSMAYRAVRNRRFDAHREWMIRSYVLIWAFVFCRLVGRFEGVEQMGGGNAFIWLSWVGPLIVGEIALQWKAGAGHAVRPNPVRET